MSIVPIFVKNLLRGAKFHFGTFKNNADYAVGYTIEIRKRSDYQTAGTFKKEIERLQKWANRQPGGDCRILMVPKETHHCKQIAVVTIFDPIMMRLENAGIIK